jgi:peroxiredoxin
MGAAGDHSHSHAVIGHAAPDFTLTDADGKSHTLSEYAADGKIVVLEWFNPTCPFVVRHYEKYTTMEDLYGEFSEKEIVFLSINSAHEGHATYGHDAETSKKWGKHAPVLIDANGNVGHTYGAKTTPHMFIIDAEGVLVYNGAIDDDRGDSKPEESKTNFVRRALNEMLAGEPVSESKTKSYGCSVKYAR